jgi:hypothetical protein
MKMRDALEIAKRLVDAVKDADLCDFIYGSDFCKSCQFIPMCKAARDCESALSEPVRNYDRFNTPEEAIRMFESDMRESGKVGFINPFTEVVKWLFAPAAERKGEEDGSK